MKRKNLNLFLFPILLSSVVFAACDMVKIDNPIDKDKDKDGREITQNERDELEKTGHYLKLVNLPLNMQVTNVYSASVSNSSAPVGKLDKNKTAMIFRETGSCTVYLPLVGNDGAEFLETGSFYSSFSVHVDALTKFIVEPSDLFVVSYADGRGQADVNNLPSSAANAANRPCLTVYNLPASVSVYNFSDVFVHNRTGPIASCPDSSQIVLSVSDNKASAKIPLQYNSLNHVFSETGVFYVSFDVNVDVETRYTLSPDDKVKVTFINGNGYLDVQNIPDNPAPYLTVKGLPTNAATHHVSKVYVYNAAGPVAECRDYKLVSVIKDKDSSSFLIPLSNVSDASFFQDSGKFLVSFEINVDIDTQIVFSRSDNLILPFTIGSAEIDLKKYVKTYSDDSSLNPNSGIDLSETEKDRLEKTGHFLKLVNMPSNAQAPNFFSVSVANSSSPIAKLNNSAISIYREKDFCTVYLPLVYIDNNDFLETGSFYVSFIIHVDAVTKYIVDLSDQFLVSFIYGRGLADVKKLPSKSVITEEPRYLTVSNLPASASVNSFKNVSILNQTGPIAVGDCPQTVLSSVNGKITAKIPLRDDSTKKIFIETGAFYVSFDIIVDVENRYTVSPDDKVKVSFVKGNGFIDVLNIPDNPVPYLAIKGFPLNATKQQISNVSVYNLAGTVAKCSNYKDVSVVKENNFLTFMVPLSDSAGEGYFYDSGRFAVSFTVNVDMDVQILYSRNDNLILPFTNGSAEFDVNSYYGFFDAHLTNIDDFNRPVIKAGSSFDINGNRVKINSDTAVNALTPNSSCLIYLYAFYADSQTFYEFSTTAPTYDSKKKGWYNGTRRALWKMVYIYNTSSPKFLFKTYADDNFPQLKYFTLENSSDYSQIIASKPVCKSIDGSANYPPETVTLDPGVYVVELKGAGGGHGRAYNETSLGGQGGLVREILTLNTATSFTAFTGSGGGDAPAVAPSGTFDIVTTANNYTYSYSSNTQDQCHNFTITVSNLNYHSTNTVVKAVTITGTNQAMSGGGAGGGGSGSFLYSSGSNGNYLLLAAGGGGGSGGSYFTPGGAGGAGGSIGPGAGGGGSGSFTQNSDVGVGNFNSPGGSGGSGGGFGGGNAGAVSCNGGNADSVIPSNALSSGGSSASSYSASLFDITSKNPFLSYPVSCIIAAGSNPTLFTSNNRAVTVRTQFSFSGNSGSGGSTPSISFLQGGPQAWLDTNCAGGSGASPLPLNAISSTGSISFSVGRNVSINCQASYDSSTLAITIGAPNPGQDASSGGNNRNSSRGDGASSGAAGSVTIHKIY